MQQLLCRSLLLLLRLSAGQQQAQQELEQFK
jgi:hypothetical protein